jgi:3-keto-L-gulonate-6-phosphate decarboxylase
MAILLVVSRFGPGAVRRLARRADVPKHHVVLADREVLRGGRIQAGPFPGRAADTLGVVATPAHQVTVAAVAEPSGSTGAKVITRPWFPGFPE